VAVIIDIADAVTAELNAHAAELIEGGFNAVRHYRPVHDLREMNVLRVTVVPRGVSITPIMRGKNQHDVQIDVAVQKKVDDADHAVMDELMGLVERIGDVFDPRNGPLASLPQANWISAVNKPIYSMEHLDQFRAFTSVLTLTYRVMR